LELRRRIAKLVKVTLARLDKHGRVPEAKEAIEEVIFNGIVHTAMEGGDPFAIDNVAAVAGGLLVAADIGAFLAGGGGVTGGASMWQFIEALGLVAAVPFIQDAYNRYFGEGKGEEGAAPTEKKYPDEGQRPGEEPAAEAKEFKVPEGWQANAQAEAARAGGDPGAIADLFARFAPFIQRGVLPALALNQLIENAPALRDIVRNAVPGWDGYRGFTEKEGNRIIAALGGHALNAVKDRVRGGIASLFKERPIELSPEDRAEAARDTYGDIKPLQDVDNEASVGDLRPSFQQLGTRAAEQSPEDSLKELVQFTNFNYVAPGFGTARNNPIAAFNREWDDQVRFTSARPYTHGMTDLSPVSLVSKIRPAIGTYASNAVVEPMQMAMIRQAMLRRQSRDAFEANLLLRDIANNTATLKPVADINTIDTDAPMTNLEPANTDFAAYWATNPVTNAMDGTVRPQVVQHGPDIGPYKQYASGISYDVPPYQTGTNPTNFYVRSAAAQFAWNNAPGAAQSAYAPSRQGLLNGLDLTATSEFLSPLGPAIGGPNRDMRQGAEIPFPSRIASADLINQGW